MVNPEKELGKDISEEWVVKIIGKKKILIPKQDSIDMNRLR